ncbi:hypothetical protein KZ810_13320 [Sphingomonas sp. RHCKR47]|uniref:hypothetical protein n=1 Tax=Sphingomonas citricola TaxID=2862498 RepID=UPI001CA57569|nr:hypothetical protein [Sphingomonas citricola]MBW6524481.1 hypothetical protein [Sphingomonas citricola]
MTTQPYSAATTPFRAAASRTARSPTAARAHAIDATRVEATRLSPLTGSFDLPTAAAVSSWRQP